MKKYGIQLLQWIFFLISAVMILLLLFPQFLHIKGYIVLSGSMEPYISVGSLVYVMTDKKAEDVKVNDVIAFILSNGSIVTHRVIHIDSENQEFTTKGDTNQNQDFTPVRFNQFQGIVKGSIPNLGYWIQWFQTTTGKVLLVFIILLQFCLSFLDTRAKTNK